MISVLSHPRRTCDSLGLNHTQAQYTHTQTQHERSEERQWGHRWEELQQQQGWSESLGIYRCVCLCVHERNSSIQKRKNERKRERAREGLCSAPFAIQYMWTAISYLDTMSVAVAGHHCTLHQTRLSRVILSDNTKQHLLASSRCVL